jgi:predicted metal-dependent enzyme (double-stranded beta helix superfamily)
MSQKGRSTMSSSLSVTLAAFVDDVETLVSGEPDVQRIALGVQARLPTLLSEPDFLPSESREPDPIRYRSHLLAVAPSRRFSVMSLVWLPGQTTPIHDHISWCVVGVMQGLECEQRYTLRQGSEGDRWLVPLEETTLTVGHTSILVPPEENLHQVRNAGDTLAISLHVYGADLEVWGNSINQCFDALPVRMGDLSGECVPWRPARTGWAVS